MYITEDKTLEIIKKYNILVIDIQDWNKMRYKDKNKLVESLDFDGGARLFILIWSAKDIPDKHMREQALKRDVLKKSPKKQKKQSPKKPAKKPKKQSPKKPKKQSPKKQGKKSAKMYSSVTTKGKGTTMRLVARSYVEEAGGKDGDICNIRPLLPKSDFRKLKISDKNGKKRITWAKGKFENESNCRVNHKDYLN